MNTFFKLITMGLLAAQMMACSSIPVNSNARHVIITPNPPPKGCRYVDQVAGNQGNFFTGGWTSNANMEIGAMNDMRNKAAQLGANYVQLVTSRAGNTGSGGFGSNGGGGGYEQTNVTNTGNAYYCPPNISY